MTGFKGDLKDFSVAQLLNLVHLSQKSGSLFLDSEGRRIRFSFRNGRLAYARPEHEKNDLVDILRPGGRVELQRQVEIRKRLETSSELEVGLELAMEGVISRQTILECIREYSVEVLRQTFAWDEGTFEFINEDHPPQGRILLSMPLDDPITLGITHLNEQELLLKEIPTLDVELVFTDQLKGIDPQINLTGQEWQLISNINTRQTLAAIGEQTNLNEHELRRAASRLIQAGIIEIRQTADSQAAGTAEEGKVKEVKKSKFSFPLFHKSNPK